MAAMFFQDQDEMRIFFYRTSQISFLQRLVSIRRAVSVCRDEISKSEILMETDGKWFCGSGELKITCTVAQYIDLADTVKIKQWSTVSI